MSATIPAPLKPGLPPESPVRRRPSRWRRWIARTFGALVLLLLIVFAVWRVLLHREVEQRLARIRAAGLPTSGAELDAWYPAVPAEQNAALVLTQAFALLLTYPDQRSNEVKRFRPPPRGQPLSSEEKTLLTGHVQLNAEALTKAREASALPKSRYPVDYSLGMDTRLLHLVDLKAMARAAQCEALLAIESGQVPDGVRAVLTTLDCARTLVPEPTLIAQLVRISWVAMGTSTL